MAVKHKVVECREPQAELRLNLIIRALESISSENGLLGTDLGKLCENIVLGLGTVNMPTSAEDFKNFMGDVERVQEILAEACSNEEIIFATLKALYSGISDPQKQLSPTMSVVLQLIDTKKIPTAVQWILHSGYSEQNLEQALLTLCNWLSRWIWTPNLGPLVLSFMQGLEAEHHYDILIEVTLIYIESLFKLVILPDPRKSILPVVVHMLERMQHSPEAFLKIIPHINNVLSSLCKENTESSQYYVHRLVNLCMALIDHFPGYVGQFGNLKQTLEYYQPAINYKQTLNCKSWLDAANATITIRYSSGKVGLNNLGNTCYMNSVLQALFMTKLFRNDMLLSNRDTIPLFSKLQGFFALLQFSQRCSLSPSDILNLARPPGFQPGHQHDSSEFLGYLLDVLHEQERSIYTPLNCGDGPQPGPSTDNGSQPTTVIQRSFGGRAVTVSRCNNCGSQSERADSFRELQLSFPNTCENQSVQTLVDYYLQPERLCGDNQYHCDTCQGLTDGERVTRIVELPPRLILTLKHFRYDPLSQLRTKILQRVNLDEVVSLENVHYTLYAAVVHCGSSVDSGHYYTFARDELDWFKFNDCIVMRSKREELCGLKPPETPYILFYSRQDCADPEPLTKSVLSPRLQAILVKDNAEFEADKRRKQIKINSHRQNKSDEPPPPGCGGGGAIDNSHNRYVC